MAAVHSATAMGWLTGSNVGARYYSARTKKLLPFYVTIAATALAFAADLALGTFASEATDAFYIVAAAVSAYSGRWQYGLISVALGLLPNVALFKTPHYSLAIGVFGWEHVIVTSAIAVVLALIVGRLRKEEDALKTLNNELEERVRNRTADLEESNRQLEAFCYTLAHDLRAPLRAIQGFAQISVADYEKQIGADGTQTLLRIGSSAEKMGRLIQDLLSYTQLHRAEIPIGETSLQKALERVLQILDPEIRQKAAEITIVAPLPAVTGNLVLVEQVLLSLLSNALKFTRSDVPPKIRITSERRDRMVRMIIHDNGIGIPARYAEDVRLFEPFQRLDAHHKFPGTGMGLALAKKSVERLSGTIGFESEPNRGTSFWIELPK